MTGQEEEEEEEEAVPSNLAGTDFHFFYPSWADSHSVSAEFKHRVDDKCR